MFRRLREFLFPVATRGLPSEGSFLEVVPVDVGTYAFLGIGLRAALSLPEDTGIVSKGPFSNWEYPWMSGLYIEDPAKAIVTLAQTLTHAREDFREMVDGFAEGSRRITEPFRLYKYIGSLLHSTRWRDWRGVPDYPFISACYRQGQCIAVIREGIPGRSYHASVLAEDGVSIYRGVFTEYTALSWANNKRDLTWPKLSKVLHKRKYRHPLDLWRLPVKPLN